MTRTIDLTLGVPIYNSRDSLPDLFRALLAQSVLPRRIVFFDDCSPDDSLEAVRAFRPSLPDDLEVVLERSPRNLGTAGAYNAIAALARSEWTQILDADDYILGDYYATVERCLLPGDAALVTAMRSNVRLINLVNAAFRPFIPENVHRFPVLGAFATRSGIIYNTALLKKTPFRDPFFDGSDILQLLDMAKQGRCRYTRRAMVYYRIHFGAQTNSAGGDRYINELRARGELGPLFRIDHMLRKRVFSFIRRMC
jgi:glycosyltransferase involved in cell wall biosynthesis